MNSMQKILEMAAKKAEGPKGPAKTLDDIANEPMDSMKETFIRKYHIKNILKYASPEDLIIDVHKTLDSLNNSITVEDRNLLLMKFLKEWRDANV